MSVTAKKSRRLTVAAMLSAAAFLLMYMEFPLPFLIPSFIKLDISDLPELLAAFSLGPVWGIAVSLLKNVLFVFLHGTSSAYIGELSNFLLGSVFSFTAGLVYHRGRNRTTRRGALTGSILGALLMAAVSVPLNYFVVYPAYTVCYRMPLETILAMYRAILPSAGGLFECLLIFNLPFTFVKGLIDTALCFVVYRPLAPQLRGER